VLKTSRVCCRAGTVLTVHMFGMMVLLCVQVEAGAQVIITQLFYDVEKFIKFTQDCRALGIECPIIPGWSTSNRVRIAALVHCLTRRITFSVITLLAWIQTMKACCSGPKQL
jgi:2-methylisocitrate lyase-like PEP mutase family enzyme